MKRLNKILFVAFFLGVARFITSCCTCNYDDYEWIWTDAQLRVFNTEAYYYDEQTTNTFSDLNFGIEVYLVPEVKSRKVPVPSASSAMAFQCDCYVNERMLSRIEKIDIRATTNFATIPAGESLNEKFRALPFMYYNDYNEFYEIDSLINTLNDWANEQRIDGFSLYLKENLTEDTETSFIIEFTTNEGTVFTDSTVVVNLRSTN